MMNVGYKKSLVWMMNWCYVVWVNFVVGGEFS